MVHIFVATVMLPRQMKRADLCKVKTWWRSWSVPTGNWFARETNAVWDVNAESTSGGDKIKIL